MYLLNNQTYIEGTVSVSETVSVKGVFIAPDGFVGGESALTAAVKDWETAQNAGILFLPAAGDRNTDKFEVLCVNDIGFYWSSTKQVSTSDDEAHCLVICNAAPDITVYDRKMGFSVRLVTDAQ